VDNADRDIVQQEAAAFWHCHDVPAVPISLYSSRFDLFFKEFGIFTRFFPIYFLPFLSRTLTPFLVNWTLVRDL